MARHKQTSISKTRRYAQTTSDVATKMNKAVETNDDAIQKKVRRKKPGTAALQEMRRLQKGSNHSYIRKTPFRRVVKEIANDMSLHGSGGIRIDPRAIRILMEAAEAFTTEIFQLANVFSVKNRRVMVDVSDFKIAANVVTGRWKSYMTMRDGATRTINNGFTGTFAGYLPSPLKYTENANKPAKKKKQNAPIDTKVIE